MHSFLFFGVGIGIVLISGFEVAAAVTGWTNPTISGDKDGSGTAATKLKDNLKAGQSTDIKLVAAGGVTYALTKNEEHGVIFSIVQSGTGAGTLNIKSGTVDYETSTTYVIVATATDSGGTTTGTATVTLSVEDVNEPPEFMPHIFVTSVTDGSTENTKVYKVNATDHDAGDNGKITGYSVTGGQFSNDFDIDSTGQIKVASEKKISRERSPGYFLQVVAKDGGTPSLSGTTTIAIAVVAPSSAAICGAGSLATLMLAILFAMLN